MTPEALAGSKKPLRSARSGGYMVERLAGKALDLSKRHERQTCEEIQKVRFGSFSRRAERASSDLLRVGDLLMLVFGWRRQRLHRRRRDEKRNRIAFDVLDSAEGGFLFRRRMTPKAIETKA